MKANGQGNIGAIADGQGTKGAQGLRHQKAALSHDEHAGIAESEFLVSGMYGSWKTWKTWKTGMTSGYSLAMTLGSCALQGTGKIM